MVTANRLIACLALTLTASCATYRPKTPLPGSYRKQLLADVSQPALLKNYNAMPDGKDENDSLRAVKVARRNQILQELIMIVDQNYSTFEEKYYGSDAAINFAGDAVNIGLTGVSSMTGTARLKSVLAAIATGTTGIKTSYLKNYYDQQTRTAVVQKMRALRASELAILQDEHHMKAGLSDYSLESGLSDIEAYYNAGTIIGALQSMAEAAGIQQSAARQQQMENAKARQALK